MAMSTWRRSVIAAGLVGAVAAPLGLVTSTAGAATAAGSAPLVRGCDADARVLAIGVQAMMASEPTSYPGANGRATSAEWRRALVPEWLPRWPGRPQVYALTVAGTRTQRVDGVRTHDGDVLVTDYLDRHVYDFSVLGERACDHFSFSLRFLGASGPSPSEVVLPTIASRWRVAARGAGNGPLTETVLNDYGLIPGTKEYDLLRSQGLGGYLRTWTNPFFGFAQIFEFQLRDATAAETITRLLARPERGVRTVAVSTPRPGWRITGTERVHGVTLRLVGYVITDGSYSFVGLFALYPAPGDASFAESVVARQADRLDDLLAVPWYRSTDVLAGGSAGVLLVAVLPIVTSKLRRKRRGSKKARGAAGPAPMRGVPASSFGGVVRAPATEHSSMATAPARQRSAVAVLERYFCSWCGIERRSDSHSLHHCGSRDRDPVFCSRCGRSLDGAAACRDCGVSASVLSPR